MHFFGLPGQKIYDPHRFFPPGRVTQNRHFLRMALHTRSEGIFEEYQNVSHPGQILYKCFAPRAKTRQMFRTPFPDLLSINNRSIMYGVEPKQMFRTPGRHVNVSYPGQTKRNFPPTGYAVLKMYNP